MGFSVSQITLDEYARKVNSVKKVQWDSPDGCLFNPRIVTLSSHLIENVSSTLIELVKKPSNDFKVKKVLEVMGFFSFSLKLVRGLTFLILSCLFNLVFFEFGDDILHLL
jgi:hypothetical protein